MHPANRWISCDDLRTAYLGSVAALSVLILSWASPSGATLAPTCGSAVCTFEIGGGWEVDVQPDFVNLGLIDIFPNNLTPDVSIELTKHAEFLINNTLALTFRQVAVDAVPTIIINNESVQNSTDLGPDPATAWVGFEIEALNGGDAMFDAIASAGFDISPFDTLTFINADTKLIASGGGSVPAGGFWLPGASGDLVIATIPGAGTLEDPFTVFSFKETPVPVPEPGSLVLLGLGIAGLRARRRSGS